MILYPNIGPYMGTIIDAIKTIKINGQARHFRVIGYTAYNAMGLIGTESHGLAILDDDAKEVIADEIGVGTVGYPALDPSALMSLHISIMAQNGAAFRKTVNGARRLRRGI